jgi:hypothetical protein
MIVFTGNKVIKKSQNCRLKGILNFFTGLCFLEGSGSRYESVQIRIWIRETLKKLTDPDPDPQQ